MTSQRSLQIWVLSSVGGVTLCGWTPSQWLLLPTCGGSRISQLPRWTPVSAHLWAWTVSDLQVQPSTWTLTSLLLPLLALCLHHPSPLHYSTRNFHVSRPSLANLFLKDQVLDISGFVGWSLVSAAYSSLLFTYSLEFFKNLKAMLSLAGWWVVVCCSLLWTSRVGCGLAGTPTCEVFVF